MEEIEQSPYQLVGAVFLKEATRSFYSRRLRVLKRKIASIGESWFLTLSVIGESHFVTVYNRVEKRLALVELLACVNPRKRGMFPSDWRSMNNCQSFRMGEPGSVYFLEVRIEAPTRQRDEWLPTLPDGCTPLLTLRQTFPGRLNPRTMVLLGLADDVLHIASLHEYRTNDSGLITPATSASEIDLARLVAHGG